jgi:hypothetical protein
LARISFIAGIAFPAVSFIMPFLSSPNTKPPRLIALLFNSPPLELVLILLLGIIVCAQLLHEKGKGWRSRVVIMVSFILVLVSHVLILLESGSNEYDLYLLARGLQMVGFGLMVVFLYRLGRVS